MSRGLRRVTPDKYPVTVAKPNLDVAYIDPKGQAAYVEHYYTKSLEEWQDKMNRGAIDYYLKHYDEFFAHNPDMRDDKDVKGHQKYKEED